MYAGTVASRPAGRGPGNEVVTRAGASGQLTAHVWSAFGACLFIVLAFQFKLGINTFPMVLLIYGVGTFLSGAVIQFRPLILGGIFCWALAIACFFISAENQLLLLCASLLGAYIIPGYILRSRFNVQ